VNGSKHTNELTFTLTAAQWQEIVAHVQSERPNEACGLLGGEGGEVRQVYLVENIRHSPMEYEMHPEQQVRAMLDIETRGGELIGIFHSHPSGPPAPSTTDVKRAYYPEAMYLIVSPGESGGWQGRGFRIEGGHVEAVPLQIVG